MSASLDHSSAAAHRQEPGAGIAWPSCRRNAERPGHLAAGPFSSTRVFVVRSADGVSTIRRRALLVRAVSKSMSAWLLAHGRDGDSIRLAPAGDGG